MKARIRIELPPGAEATPGVRAKLVERVATRLGVDAHVHGPGCGCDALEKSERELRKLRHRAPQHAVDASTEVVEKLYRKMIDDIASILAE